MSCAAVRAMLGNYLTGDLPPPRATVIRCHLDQCQPCWQAWNRLRWDAASHTPLYAELAEYLGDRFIPYLDSSRQLADEWDRANARTADQVRWFYRNTEAYLYNQVIWHASGNRPRYVEAALPVLSAHRDSVILDYGCGIGEDTLALHHAGFNVIACDLTSPPTDFLTWRAERHGYPSPVYEPDDLPTAAQPEILWIMDTLDHLLDLDHSLGPVLRRTKLAICEHLLTSRAHGRQGFHYRRSLPAIDTVFNAYGLRRAHNRNQVVTIWRRAAPADQPSG